MSRSIEPGASWSKPDLSIPGHPEVFVVGDAAAFADETGRPLPGVAQVAIQQATHAAKTIVNRLRGMPSTPFVFHDKGSMAIVGRGAAIADLGWIRFSGFPAWLAWLFLHIVKLVGFRNRLIVLLEWAVAYMTFQRSARLITNVNRSDRSERHGSAFAPLMCSSLFRSGVSMPARRRPAPHAGKCRFAYALSLASRVRTTSNGIRRGMHRQR